MVASTVVPGAIVCVYKGLNVALGLSIRSQETCLTEIVATLGITNDISVTPENDF